MKDTQIVNTIPHAAVISLSSRRIYGRGEKTPLVVVNPDLRPEGRLILRLEDGADLDERHVATINAGITAGAATMIMVADMEHGWRVFQAVLRRQEGGV